MENDGQARESLVWTWVAFGEQVRGLRKAAGLTQSGLASRLGELGVEMHQTMIAKIEAGSRPTAVHEVWAIAKVLGVDYATLLPPLKDAGEFAAEELMRAYADAHVQAQVLEQRASEAREKLMKIEAGLHKARRDVFELETQLPASVREQWSRETN